MLEVAAEREEVAEFLDVMAEETFSNLGEQDFFEPPQTGVVPPPTGVEFKAIPPAPTVAQPPKPPAEPLKLNREPRYLLRNNNTARYRRG
jgi:hypothetical protein